MVDTTSDPHAPASAEEVRALGAEDLQLADMARHPALGQMSDRELSDLVARLRTRRNRARDIADRQGREARAKAPPAGAAPASGNSGTLSKHGYLNAALDRALAERAIRGQGGDAAPSQHDLATKAMEMKRSNKAVPSEMLEDGGPLHPDDPDASGGKAGMANTARRGPMTGAFDHAGELPSRERSRTRY